MADPYAVFRSNPNRQKTLLALWPDLYNALAGTAGPEDKPPPPKKWPCVLAGHRGPRAEAVGRIGRWGPTACQSCIDSYAGNENVWPLDLIKHRPPGAK